MGKMVAAKLKRRRAFEAGHRPKYLVIADDSPEFEKALYFATRRSARYGASLLTLYVIKPATEQQWLGVSDLMQAEAEEEADAVLERAAVFSRKIAGIEPERLVRTGSKVEEIMKLIAEDEDISVMVLAAGTGAEGPGPLIALLASKTGAPFPIPVTIVPGYLPDDELDALT